MNVDLPRLRVQPLPRPHGVPTERRHCRSDNAAEALELALNSAARRGQLDDHGRGHPAPVNEAEDQLEIPAFLRRQAN